MENRVPISGTVVEMYEMKVISSYLRKREFKIRHTDTDFKGGIVERIIKFALINQDVPLLDTVRIDDTVVVSYYIDGRDYTKEDKIVNYTSLVCYEIEVTSSRSRDTKEDGDYAVIRGGTAPLKQSTLDELMITPGQEVEVFPDKNEKDEFSDLPF